MADTGTTTGELTRRPKAGHRFFGFRVAICICTVVSLHPHGSGALDRRGTYIRPRVIVDVLPKKVGGRWNHELIRVVLRLKNGRVLEGHLHGCPEIREVDCTYSFFTAPKDREVLLIVMEAGSNKPLAQRTVALPPFDREGKKALYIKVDFKQDGPVSISASTIISMSDH